ncbi:MAG: serine/threonine protein kinase [Planctomycetaceae bacterium]|jgi:serine/threonine protein kinase|nr:serine/threonine protein kinase [Planctomycetaceae bacterium]
MDLRHTTTPNQEKTDPAVPRTVAPQYIGDYEIIEEIGEGGMGVVYKAKHRFLNQTAAVKVLPSQLLSDSQAVSRFRREMQLIGSLNHPNIVRALNAGEINGSHYLAMEFVDGLTLEKLLHQITVQRKKTLPKMPLAAACEAVRQAALGLQNAHELQLIHRDIKPANLMVDQRGCVKILDLGLGKFQSDTFTDSQETALTLAGMTLGTVDYISPEQCENASSTDIRSDLYSLGCTLYFLLTGEAVYSGPRYETLRNKLMAHIVGAVPDVRSLIPSLPEEFNAVLQKVLAKEPAKRYQTPLEFAEALEPFASFEEFYSELQTDGAIKSAYKPPSSHTLYSQNIKPVKRFKLIAALVLIHLIVFGGLFAWAWYAFVYSKGESVSIANQAGEAAVPAANDTLPAEITDILLLPGLNGSWWFDEIPWYLPGVRLLAADAVSRIDAKAVPDLYDPNVPAVYAALENLLKEHQKKLLPHEQILVGELRQLQKKTTADADNTVQNTAAFYTALLNTFNSKEPQRGVDWHTLALLEHRLTLLSDSADEKKTHNKAAAEHYGKALQQYRLEAGVLTRKLEFLCLADYARLPADFKTQFDRFEEITKQRKTGERLGVLFTAEYRATYGTLCAAAHQYDDTQFTRGKDSLLRDRERNSMHPLTAYLSEQYAAGLMSQWKMTDAEKQWTDALIIRAANYKETNNPQAFLRLYQDNNARALSFRYLGNTQRAGEEYRSTLQRLAAANTKEASSAAAVIRAAKEQLADCTLFGGAAAQAAAAKLAEAQKLYEEAGCPLKAAAALLLQDKTEEAKKIIAAVPAGGLMYQWTEALAAYKTTGEQDKLRQFLLQFSVLNNPLDKEAFEPAVMDLRLFAAELLVSEDRRKNDLPALGDDIKTLTAAAVLFIRYPGARPFIRRIGDLIVRSLATMYESQSDTAVRQNLLDGIVHLLIQERQTAKEPEAAVKPSDTGASAPLPVLLVYFLTDDAQDGFVIFYPQDGRRGSLYRLPLTRRDIKSGKEKDAAKHLPAELLSLLETEHQADRTVQKSWSDAAAYSQPDEALSDAEYPFGNLGSLPSAR